mgnify:CR=1 FL=1
MTIWQELLKIGEVGLKDNFFAAGGDSLLAARVMPSALAATT